MIIEKKKVYTATEHVDKWVLKCENGKISFSFNVPKDLCLTFDELKSYVNDNDIF